MSIPDQNYNDHRFIVVENPLDNTYTVVLSDFGFWADRETDLLNYCKYNNISYQGIIVTRLLESDVMMFKLTWS